VDVKLLIQATGKLLAGLILTAVFLFVPAGTLSFWNAWLFMALLFVPMGFAGLALWIRNPELLQKRLNAKEREPEQRAVIWGGGLMFLLGFLAAGLNRRFGWTALPDWMVFASGAVFLAAYALYAEVLRENAYLSRVVEIQKGQKVIDTGLYGVVRHPMYTSTLFLFLTVPLMLGSLPSLLIFLAYPALVARRIRNEEKVLEAGLPGYAEYKKRVRYRILPGLW
jgi:protein-S-isoprenylcysteine O-methyltransferase Ste14